MSVEKIPDREVLERTFYGLAAGAVPLGRSGEAYGGAYTDVCEVMGKYMSVEKIPDRETCAVFFCFMGDFLSHKANLSCLSLFHTFINTIIYGYEIKHIA